MQARCYIAWCDMGFWWLLACYLWMIRRTLRIIILFFVFFFFFLWRGSVGIFIMWNGDLKGLISIIWWMLPFFWWNGGCYLDVYLRTFFFFWKKYKVQEWIWYNKTGTRFNKNKIRLVYFKQTLYIINFIIDPWGVGNDEIAPSVSLPLYLMDENYIIYSTAFWP